MILIQVFVFLFFYRLGGHGIFYDMLNRIYLHFTKFILKPLSMLDFKFRFNHNHGVRSTAGGLGIS